MLSSINAGVLVLHKTPIASWVTEGFVNISTENGFLSYELQSKNIFNLLLFIFAVFSILCIIIMDFKKYQCGLQMGLPQAQIPSMCLPVLEYDSSPMNKPDVQQ